MFGDGSSALGASVAGLLATRATADGASAVTFDQRLAELSAQRAAVDTVARTEDEEVRDSARLAQVVKRYRFTVHSAATVRRCIEETEKATKTFEDEWQQHANALRNLLTASGRLGCDASTSKEASDALDACRAAFQKVAESARTHANAEVTRLRPDLERHELVAGCIREVLIEAYKQHATAAAAAAAETEPVPTDGDGGDGVAAALTCPVCFERRVQRCYTACGHALCSECETRSGSRRCPVCRSEGGTVRLFLLMGE